MDLNELKKIFQYHAAINKELPKGENGERLIKAVWQIFEKYDLHQISSAEWSGVVYSLWYMHLLSFWGTNYNNKSMEAASLLNLLANGTGLQLSSVGETIEITNEDIKKELIITLYTILYEKKSSYIFTEESKVSLGIDKSNSRIKDLVFPNISDLGNDISIINSSSFNNLLSAILSIEKERADAVKKAKGKKGKRGSDNTFSPLIGLLAERFLAINDEVLSQLQKTDQYCITGEIIRLVNGIQFPEEKWNNANRAGKYIMVKDWLKPFSQI